MLLQQDVCSLWDWERDVVLLLFFISFTVSKPQRALHDCNLNFPNGCMKSGDGGGAGIPAACGAPAGDKSKL